MSVTNVSNKVIFLGDNISVTFPYLFRIYLTTDIVAKKYVVATKVFTTLVEGVDYSVSGAGSTTGGNVTLLLGVLPTGTNLIIRRVLPKTQLIDMEDNEGTPSATFEEGYDRAVMLIQELQEQLNRSIIQDDAQTNTLTFPALEVGKFLTNNGTALSWASVVQTITNYNGAMIAGADASKSATPSVNDIYVAVDSKRLYICFTSNVWDKVNLLTGNDADKLAVPKIGDIYFASDTVKFYYCSVAGVWVEYTFSIFSQTPKTTPAANDIFLIEDSAAVYAKKKIKYSELGIPSIPSGSSIKTVYSQDLGPRSLVVAKAIPDDDTKPQNDEGIEYTQISTIITPSSASNILLVQVHLTFPLGAFSQSTMIACLFKDAETDARAVTWNGVSTNASGANSQIFLQYLMVAGSTSAITFKVRIGQPGGLSTIIFNEMGSSGSDFGDLGISSMTVTEIKA